MLFHVFISNYTPTSQTSTAWVYIHSCILASDVHHCILFTGTLHVWWSVRQVGPKIGFLGTDGPQSTSADQSLCHDDISRFIDHCRAPFAIATQHCQSPLPPHTPWHYLAYREHASSHSDQHHDKPAPAPITLPHTSQRHYTSISSLSHGDREHSPHDRYILAAEEQQRPTVDHSQRIFPSVRQKQSSTRARTTQATKCPSP